MQAYRLERQCGRFAAPIWRVTDDLALFVRIRVEVFAPESDEQEEVADHDPTTTVPTIPTNMPMIPQT
jgi:hypothetical protein